MSVTLYLGIILVGLSLLRRRTPLILWVAVFIPTDATNQFASYLFPVSFYPLPGFSPSANPDPLTSTLTHLYQPWPTYIVTCFISTVTRFRISLGYLSTAYVPLLTVCYHSPTYPQTTGNVLSISNWHQLPAWFFWQCLIYSLYLPFKFYNVAL